MGLWIWKDWQLCRWFELSHVIWPSGSPAPFLHPNLVIIFTGALVQFDFFHSPDRHDGHVFVRSCSWNVNVSVLLSVAGTHRSFCFCFSTWDHFLFLFGSGRSADVKILCFFLHLIKVPCKDFLLAGASRSVLLFKKLFMYFTVCALPANAVPLA